MTSRLGPILGPFWVTVGRPEACWGVVGPCLVTSWIVLALVSMLVSALVLLMVLILVSVRVLLVVLLLARVNASCIADCVLFLVCRSGLVGV